MRLWQISRTCLLRRKAPGTARPARYRRSFPPHRYGGACASWSCSCAWPVYPFQQGRSEGPARVHPIVFLCSFGFSSKFVSKLFDSPSDTGRRCACRDLERVGDLLCGIAAEVFECDHFP